MLSVDQLTKRYGDRTAVRDVTFSVEKGEIVGFLGPNGAGKTTTLRMITGFLAPTAGGVRVGGVDALTDPLRARSQIGYMPEGVPLYPEMRVSEYLRYRARLKGVPRSDVKKRVGEALEMAGVTDARERIIGQLSKGYKQRVGLADALVADPPLLILDEPTSGLDPNQMRSVRELVRGFAGTKTVFLSTHILPEVEATCTRVVIIHDGRVVGEGPPETLRGGEDAHVVTLVGRGDREKLRGVLEAVEGVREVLALDAVGDELSEGRLRTDPSPEVVERVFRAVADAGLVLRELRRESAKLEDVFARLTTREADVAEPKDDEPEEAEEAEPKDDEPEEAEEAEPKDDEPEEAEPKDDEPEEEADK